MRGNSNLPWEFRRGSLVKPRPDEMSMMRPYHYWFQTLPKSCPNLAYALRMRIATLWLQTFGFRRLFGG